MSTQLSENTVKVPLSALRKHCRDLLEKAEPDIGVPPQPQSDGVREDAATRERRA